MIIKTFDDLASLSERYDSIVFQDINDDTLLVQDRVNNTWYRYRWARGRREINFLEELSGSELPLMTQVYPTI